MLLLHSFGLPDDNQQAKKACNLLLDKGYYRDGGINFFKSLDHSETCVTGMMLLLTSYFKINDQRIFSIVEWLLQQQMSDGGWNCESFNGGNSYT